MSIRIKKPLRNKRVCNISFIADRMKNLIEDGIICPFIYLHGDIQNECGYDIVRFKDDYSKHLLEETLKTYDTRELESSVLFFDNIEKETILFVWRAGFRNIGLIVDKNDKESIEYGRRQLKEKPMFI